LVCISEPYGRFSSRVAMAAQSPVHFVSSKLLPKLVESFGDVVVISPNGSFFQEIGTDKKRKFIFDFYASVKLELEESGATHERILDVLNKKYQKIQMSDGFLLNGIKKKPLLEYYCEEAGIDLSSFPLENALFGFPLREKNSVRHPRFDKFERKLRVLEGGYSHRWVAPVRDGFLREQAERGNIELFSLRVVHTNQANREKIGGISSGSSVTSCADKTQSINMRMSSDEYEDLLSSIDIFVDLFPRSPERELAMVTRTCQAVRFGCHVVHPNFSEVAEVIKGKDCGWLFSEEDSLEKIWGEASSRRNGGPRKDLFDPVIEARSVARLIANL